jgi:hypothetical protein
MKIILRIEDYDGANMSEDHHCVDCGRNTPPGTPTRAGVEAMFAAGHRAFFTVCGALEARQEDCALQQ